MLKCFKYLKQEYDVDLFIKNTTTKDIVEDMLKRKGIEEPFYIVNISNIIESYVKWTKMLPHIKPYYAVKCNHNIVLLKTLALLGCNFDCASKNEIEKIMDIVDDAKRIIFANPCKVKSHLQYANLHNILLMTFDCEEELYKIKKFHPHAKLIIRIAVDDSKSLCKFSSKFGCSLKEVSYLLERANELGLNVEGVSFHVGSSCMSTSSFYQAISDCKQVVNIAKELNIIMKTVNIGGGFPGNDKIINMEDIAVSIRGAINDFFFEEVKNNQIQFIAEPGRYFAQNSHTLVLSITGKKSIVDEFGEKIFIYYLNDGLYNSFNCIIFDHASFDLIPLFRREGCQYRSKIFGPTCDSMDLVKENILLPEYFIGDYFYVEDFGAYTVSPSSGFNGFVTDINKYVLIDRLDNSIV